MPIDGDSALAKASARATLTVTRHVEDLAKAGIVVGDPQEIGRALWAAAHGVIVLYLAGRLPKGADVRNLYFATMRLTLRGARSPVGSTVSSIATARCGSNATDRVVSPTASAGSITSTPRT